MFLDFQKVTLFLLFKAVAEERVCFTRATSRMVYLNLAVNALKRLRTNKEVGEAAQELIDKEPQCKASSIALSPILKKINVQYAVREPSWSSSHDC